MAPTHSTASSAPPSSPAGDGDFYFADGTMQFNAPSYVERAADRELYEALTHPRLA